MRAMGRGDWTIPVLLDRLLLILQITIFSLKGHSQYSHTQKYNPGCYELNPNRFTVHTQTPSGLGSGLEK